MFALFQTLRKENCLANCNKSMVKEDVLFGYALLDNTRQVVGIGEIDRSFTRMHKFYCPHCHKEMYATLGEIRQRHFRHKGDKCQYSKYLHDLAEHVFLEEYTKCLKEGLPFNFEFSIPRPCNEACVLKQHADCKEHYFHRKVDLTKEYTRISLETRVEIDERYRRPDILLESLDGKQLWVEIWVSHETEVDKRKDGRIIEIKIESEEDLEMIRRHNIVLSQGRGQIIRVFNIDADVADSLFLDDERLVCGYPCEKYFCLEFGTFEPKVEVIDYIKDTIGRGLKYRVILRLNWKGRHDTTEGFKGKQTTLDELRDVFSRRFLSYSMDGGLNYDKSYDELIITEWKDKSVRPNPAPRSTPSYPSQNRQYRRVPEQPAATTADISEVEWIDLGLPSGTLWAKEDTGGGMPFETARTTYGANLPTNKMAEELQEYCVKKWDYQAHALVLTGQNGNSISFFYNRSCKSYWLRDYDDAGDLLYARCFHIEAGYPFWINNADVTHDLNIRLVK